MKRSVRQRGVGLLVNMSFDANIRISRLLHWFGEKRVWSQKRQKEKKEGEREGGDKIRKGERKGTVP